MSGLTLISGIEPGIETTAAAIAPSPRASTLIRFLTILTAASGLCVLPACRSIPHTTTPAYACPGGSICSPTSDSDTDPLLRASSYKDLALTRGNSRRSKLELKHWMNCATTAFSEMGSSDGERAKSAAALATECNSQALTTVFLENPREWSTGAKMIDKQPIHVEFRGLSPWLEGSLRIVPASFVSSPKNANERVRVSGFGLPVVVTTPRCTRAPQCALFPAEGIYQGATAWLEPHPTTPDAPPTLVIANPDRTGALLVGDRHYDLAMDPSAFYELGANVSVLPRLGVFGLFGGRGAAHRAGVYLLQEYDPSKRPLIMIHGLGSNPLIWAKMSGAIWADPVLRTHYQVWHVVYPTNAPLLISRMRIQTYLDHAWNLLDPEGDDLARQEIVLIGHSLGGVISRLLCVDSGYTLWDSAFTVPPERLPADDADRRGIEATFLLRPYPGVKRAIFLAAPHRGSPMADRWLGRLVRVLAGRRTAEVQALRRLATLHPESVQPEVRDAYRSASLNSIVTLQIAQPVRRAGEGLMPPPTIPYHTIAGSLPGQTPPGDGAVPLESALLDGAASTLVINANHDLYLRQESITEVVRILHLHLAPTDLQSTYLNH